MFMRQQRPANTTELVGHFTPEEANRLTHLHDLFRAYPACYTFELDYRRLEFARWLREHGRIDEWREASAAPQPSATTHQTEPDPHERCA